MKKYYFLIIVVLILGLVLTGCFLSNVGQVPTTGQSGIAYLTKVGPTEEEAESFPLYAGQDWEVGEVLVWDDGTQLCVKYQLFSEVFDPEEGEGWGITETHLAVGYVVGDIPQTKKGNPIPGQFLYGNDELGGVEFYEEECIPFDDLGIICGDSLVIAAHAVIEKIECGDLTEAPYGGFQVVDSSQGLLYSYLNIKLARSNPDAVLTFETGHNESYFFSLGFQEDRPEFLPADDAWIIVEFNIPIQNGPGDDLQVIEDTWGLPYPDETADVWVKQNVTDEWTYLGEANNQNPISGYHTITNFDLGALDWVKYVKVQDTSNRADFALVSLPDGYDLNAIVALQDYQECTTYSETAWGAVSKGNEQFDGANWATYFNYEVCSCENVPEVINGGFELPVVTAGAGWDIYPLGTAGLGWTVEWADTYTDAPATANLELHKSGTVVDAYEGAQYAELDTDWEGPSSTSSGEEASVKIYQDLETCPGVSYTLTYAWHPRNTVSMMKVYWNDVEVASHGGSPASWTTESIPVTQTGYSARLEFIETGTADSLGMFLDDVSVDIP